MNSKNQSRYWLLARASMIATGAALLCGPAFAQNASGADVPPGPSDAAQAPPGSQPGAPGPTGPQRVREANAASTAIIITGTALRTSPDQVAVPVSIINSEAIAKGGVANNALELVRKQIPSFAGRSNTGNSNATNTNQNTAGGSQAQLRNLDTLVLINGRRAAVNPIAGLGGKVFVDLAEIPVGAVDRVEVLTDGASAIYGSDAVGGVINFILKKNYEGAEADGRFAFANGGYHERSANLTVGHNITPAINLTLSASYSKTDPLYQRQRSFASPFYLTSTAVPGTVVTGGLFGVLAPGLTSPSQANPTGILATAPNFAALVANGTYVNTPTLVSPQTSPPTATSNIPIAGTGIGGTYDLSRFQTMLLGQEQKALAGSASAKIIGDDLVFFVDGLYADNRSFAQFKPVTLGVSMPKNAPFNPIAGTLPGITFGDPDLPKRYFNRAKFFRIVPGIRGNLPFIGSGWNYEIAYDHSYNTLDQRQQNVIYTPNVARAIAGGFDANGDVLAGGGYSKVYSGFSLTSPLVLVPALDPLSRNPNATTLGYLFGTERLHATSKLDGIDGKVTGSFLKLPAGMIQFAAGAAYRKESLSGVTDANGYVHADPNFCNDGGALVSNPSQWTGGQQADPFPVSCSTAAAGSSTPGGRKISSVFSEVRVPILGGDLAIPGFHKFDLIGAIRHEHYSDAGNSTVPKLGFFWQPVDRGLTIRGTYSKSFTAPPLYQEYGPVNFRLGGPAIITNTFGLANSGFQAEDGVNPNLQPAKAQTYSIGAVVQPALVPGLRLEANYSFVKERGFPGGIGFSNIFLDVNEKGSASAFANNIALGNFPGQPGAVAFANPGDLRAYLAANPSNSLNVYTIDRFTNLGGIRVKSLNGNLDYSRPLGNMGTLSFNSAIAVFLSYKFQALPSQKFYEYAGKATNGGTGVQGIIPKVHTYSSLDWTYGNFDLTVAHTFISKIRDFGVGGITFETNAAKNPPTAFVGHIKAYNVFDLRLGYSLKDLNGHPSGIAFAAGMNNIFNRMPPISTNVNTPSAAFTDLPADVSTYSPIGRLTYVQASLKF
jgi:iron complex outermembrane receptor protein